MRATVETLRRLLLALTEDRVSHLTIVWSAGAPETPIDDGRPSTLTITTVGEGPNNIVLSGFRVDGLEALLKALEVDRATYDGARAGRYGDPHFQVRRAHDGQYFVIEDIS